MKRPRLECPYCGEILSYSSYRRHVETKLCAKKPESINANAILDDYEPRQEHNESTEGSFDFLEIDRGIDSHYSDHDDGDTNKQELTQCCDLPAATGSNSSSDSEGDSGPEIWDMEPDMECEPSRTIKNGHSLLYSVSYFLLFFQLCYKISDRAMKHILNLILSL